MSKLVAEYEQDFDAWIQQHINLLKQGKVAEIDVDHLIEELEDMGKSNQRELVNRFIPLIAHLLKWQYQYKQLQDQWVAFTGGSWRGTITEQRTKLAKLLKQSPSLKGKLSEAILDAYPDALKVAVSETSFPKSTFPNSCPYTIEQLLDEDFYPDIL
jgi:hypothetical protein